MPSLKTIVASCEHFANAEAIAGESSAIPPDDLYLDGIVQVFALLLLWCVVLAKAKAANSSIQLAVVDICILTVPNKPYRSGFIDFHDGASKPCYMLKC